MNIDTIPLPPGMTQDRFVRLWLQKDDPLTVAEALWFYLAQEGLAKVPLAWHCATLTTAFGALFLPILKPISEWLVSHLPRRPQSC